MTRQLSLTATDGWGDPAREAAEGSYVWIHVPARSPIVVIVLSDQPCRYTGHWVQGKMRPCPGRDCGYCAVRMGYQVRYCFAAYDLTHRISGLLELGAAAAQAIKEEQDNLGFLRGLAFELRKEGQRERGRVIVRPHHATLNPSELPKGPDPATELRRMWSLPEEERIL